MKTIDQKLAKVEADLKRWQTKLKRATNMVTKLDRQRRRLAVAKIKPPTNGVQKDALDKSLTVEEPTATVVPVDDLALVAKAVEIAKTDDLNPPRFLDRRDPKIKAELEAARLAARKKMPLSDRAAMLAIRMKSAKVTKKREKRDRPFQK